MAKNPTSREMLASGMNPIEVYRRVIAMAQSAPADLTTARADVVATARAGVVAAATLALHVLDGSTSVAEWTEEGRMNLLRPLINLCYDFERLANGELAQEELDAAAAPPSDGPPPIH